MVNQDRTARAIIGNTAKRPVWIGQKGDGTLPTFEGPIPVAEVERQLFNWEAISVPTGNFIPCEPDSIGSVMIDGEYYMPKVTPGAQGFVRSDDHSELGRHGKGYRGHGYNEWLVQNVGNIVGDTISINSALTLKNGAQAVVEVALAEWMHDTESGADFWPIILATTSFDGSIATTYSGAVRMASCDNMYQGMHSAAKNAGRQFKVRHTVNSLSADNLTGVRHALRIMEQAADGMSEFLHTLVPIKVTRKNWLDVMDIIEPPPVFGASPVALTKCDNRRQLLDSTYQNDPMVAQWAGTAFGVVQAVNTYEHHYRNVRGTSRIERVYDRAMRDDFAKADGDTLAALAKVLDRPELVMA
jgi:phage/plasmid-like protein (TIGR03299 family)